SSADSVSPSGCVPGSRHLRRQREPPPNPVPAKVKSWTCRSSAVSYTNHIPILDPVVLTFHPQGALRSCRGLGARREQCVPMYGLCPDEVLFEIRMDSPS